MSKTNKPTLRDLPYKAIYIKGFFGLPQRVDAYIVENVYNPATGKLDVHGLTDVTETDGGKKFLVRPESVGDESIGVPPIHRIYLDSGSTWVLLQHEGIWTLVFVPRYEVSHPPNSVENAGT